MSSEAEVTIYLLSGYHKKGIAKITAENITSIRFFEKNGYELAGILKDVGEKFKRTLSVAIYQKSLTRKKDQTID